MATYLYRTFSTATNRKIWTWSGWVKRTNLVSDHTNALFGAYYDGTNRSVIRFNGHRLQFQDSANSVDVLTTRLFRDPNAWYHIVARVDTTQSTASDRIRLYVNGVQETAFDTSNYPGQNINMEFQGAVVHYINARRDSTGTVDSIASMVYSHVHFSDGQSLAPTVFGETDSTTGEWKINTNPSFTLGTNGFTILKDGNTYTDQSSNSNNWTQAGSTGLISKTEDCPSNVFCTYNPLQQTNGSAGFENGSTYFTNGTQWLGVNGTIAATSGKYYAEFKVTGSTGWGIGVADVDSDANRTDYLSSANNGYQSKYTGGKQIFLNGSTIVAQENNSTVINNAGMGNTSFANNDIVMVALDLDNNNLFFGKNGTWLRGATESEIEAGTSTNATFSGTSFNNKFWTWAVTTELENMRMNAGNGYFSTTAVSSAGTNASGIGIFEYDVPDGFTALSTKGLNE